MDTMGIGPLEIVLILLLGFLFFGPEKLPGMAAKAGRWYRNFSRAANNFSRTLNEEIEREVKEIKDNKENEKLPSPNQKELYKELPDDTETK